jgi:hypothetical protein
LTHEDPRETENEENGGEEEVQQEEDGSGDTGKSIIEVAISVLTLILL